jgi:uncharacterized protein (DUF2141 family)
MATWLDSLIAFFGSLLAPQDKKARFRKLGDVNGDGVIDQTDIDLIRAAFGSSPGSINWNPNADLNGDGRVDMRDLGIASNNIGKNISSWEG